MSGVVALLSRADVRWLLPRVSLLETPPASVVSSSLLERSLSLNCSVCGCAVRDVERLPGKPPRRAEAEDRRGL